MELETFSAGVIMFIFGLSAIRSGSLGIASLLCRYRDRSRHDHREDNQITHDNSFVMWRLIQRA